MSYARTHAAGLFVLAAQHLALVGVSLAIALAIALPLGVLAARRPAFAGPVLGTAGAIYTVPSLALLGLLVVPLGIGALTAIVALVLYAQIMLLRGIVTGLRSVDPALVDAARGLGHTPRQTLLRVEFPAALPVVLGGVRVAAVTLVALATIAGWVQAGGLGSLIFDGLHTDNVDKIIAGSGGAAVLAIAIDAALRAAERFAQR